VKEKAGLVLVERGAFFYHSSVGWEKENRRLGIKLSVFEAIQIIFFFFFFPPMNKKLIIFAIAFSISNPGHGQTRFKMTKRR
jgi:hypothetical protein